MSSLPNQFGLQKEEVTLARRRCCLDSSGRRTCVAGIGAHNEAIGDLMAETVSNAFLLLLGQIGLFIVALVFGIPLIAKNGDLDVLNWSGSTILFVFVLLFACCMMVANILIGWNAVRNAQSKLSAYTSKLFVSDLLVIFIFFAMNNVITTAAGTGFSTFDSKLIVATLSPGILPEKTAFTLGSLIALSAIYLFICKQWNGEYHRLANSPNMNLIKAYERKMSHVIFIQAIIAGFLMAAPANNFFSLALGCVWIGTWILVNWGWIAAGFTS